MSIVRHLWAVLGLNQCPTSLMRPAELPWSHPAPLRCILGKLLQSHVSLLCVRTPGERVSYPSPGSEKGLLAQGFSLLAFSLHSTTNGPDSPNFEQPCCSVRRETEATGSSTRSPQCIGRSVSEAPARLGLNQLTAGPVPR